MIVREPNPKPASEAQIDFLDKLLIEAGLSTRTLCNGWLSERADREIRYLDQLTMKEASVKNHAQPYANPRFPMGNNIGDKPTLPCPTCHGEQFITEWVSLADLLKQLAEHA